jgi:hypothetical protein
MGLSPEPEARHYRSEAPRPIVASIRKLRMNLLELQLLILASGMSSEVGLSERPPTPPEKVRPIASVVALPVQVGPYSSLRFSSSPDAPRVPDIASRGSRSRR